MGVPESIRKVARPKNTVVEDRKGNTQNRYAVRERKGYKYQPGRNSSPRNGKVIGHIIDGKFVPVVRRKKPVKPAALSYGTAALVHSVSRDIYHNLLAAFPANTATSVIAMAAVKVARPGTTAGRMAAHYGRTFLKKFYPGAALSANTVGKVYMEIGEDLSGSLQFCRMRLDSVAESHHVAVDGMLKRDTGTVNDLSGFSRKSAAKGHRDVSVLYAFDIESGEPLCAEVFPGHEIDASAYRVFICDNNIERGVVIADKGFPPSHIKEELKARPGLHFLIPLKRNDSRIKAYGMLTFAGFLPGVDGQILFRKKQINGGHFLYSFRDSSRAAAEDASYLIGREKEGGDFDVPTYEKERESFGTLVFESDQDMPPEAVYLAYRDRWLIELVFRHYKRTELLGRTSAQSYNSVAGQEFVNFISTIITCRIVRKAENAGLLDKMTYGELMEDLATAWRESSAPTETPRSDDRRWVHTQKSVLEELEALGLATPSLKPEPKKRAPKPLPKTEGQAEASGGEKAP